MKIRNILLVHSFLSQFAPMLKIQNSNTDAALSIRFL